jgi:hypothetical protein
MATIRAIISIKNQQHGVNLSSPNDTLEKITEEYILKNGGVALGFIDTPSFIRKISHVTLLHKKGLPCPKMIWEPDKKIVKFLRVLGNGDLSKAG